MSAVTHKFTGLRNKPLRSIFKFLVLNLSVEFYDIRKLKFKTRNSELETLCGPEWLSEA
jgi:hypothetical protein